MPEAEAADDVVQRAYGALEADGRPSSTPPRRSRPTVPDDGYAGPPPVVAMGGACVLFDAGGRVLLVRHTYGRLNWELPGGAAEPGESPDETAIREIREETGLEVELERLTGVYYEAGPRPDHDHGPILHVVFLAHAIGGASPEARPPEIGAVGWWPLDALPTPISDFTERRIRDAESERPAEVARIGPRRWRG